jgi:hypothetical protein
LSPVKQHEDKKTHLDLSLDAGEDESRHTKSNKKPAIALIVCGVFLLIAGGIAVWLVVGKGLVGGKVNSNNASQDISGIRKVSFVAPAKNDLPESYDWRVRSRGAQAVTVYSDYGSNCVITTAVSPIRGNDVKQTAETVIFTQSVGTETTKSVSGKPITISDVAPKLSYSLDVINLEQTVNMPGVDFTKQSAVLAYKQLGRQVVAVSYSCASDKWEAKKSDLAKIVSKFKLKTQR